MAAWFRKAKALLLGTEVVVQAPTGIARPDGEERRQAGSKRTAARAFGIDAPTQLSPPTRARPDALTRAERNATLGETIRALGPPPAKTAARADDYLGLRLAYHVPRRVHASPWQPAPLPTPLSYRTPVAPPTALPRFSGASSMPPPSTSAANLDYFLSANDSAMEARARATEAEARRRAAALTEKMERLLKINEARRAPLERDIERAEARARDLRTSREALAAPAPAADSEAGPEHVPVPVPDAAARARYLDAIDESRGTAEDLANHDRENLALTRKNLATLEVRGWLDDEVINMYIALLQDRDMAWRRDGDPGGRRRPRCHFFNTFFYNKLIQGDVRKYAYPERWTRPKKLQKVHGGKSLLENCDKIIMPIHKGNHWCCAVIDVAEQHLVYYDSFGGKDDFCLEALRQFTMDEAKQRNVDVGDAASWPLLFPTKIPRQTNGWDCGVFAVNFAEAESRCMGRPRQFDFTEPEMPNLRIRMCAELMDGTLTYKGGAV